MNLEKNILTPDNKLFSSKQERRKKNLKKLVQRYTPCPNSQSVKICAA